MRIATKEARLRLIIEAVNRTGSFGGIVAQAQQVANEVNKALSGAGATGAGSTGTTTNDPFSGIRATVEKTRGELTKFYEDTAKQFGKTLGVDIPHSAQVATNDLAKFYEKMQNVNVKVHEGHQAMDNLNKMFALQNLAQAAGYLKQFGDYLGKIIGEGMADSLDKEANLIRAVEGVLINNPEMAAAMKRGGAQAYNDFSAGLQSQLNAKAIKIGLQTTFSDNQVAAGMSILLRSGVELNDVLGDERGGVADAMAKIAMISGTDIPTAARHMISVYNQFGTQLKNDFGGDVPEAFNHVADVITNALGSSGVELNAFMNSLSYAGTASALAGQSFSDTAAVLTLFAKNGVAGSKAGTGLRRLLTSLTPSTDKAAEAIEKMTAAMGGSSDIFYDEYGNMKSLVEVQEIMAQTLAKLSPQDQIAIVRDVFGQYAIGQALILANAEEFGNLAAQVAVAGAAERQVQAIMQSGVGVTDRYTEAINTWKETVGDTNLNYITPLKENLANLIERYLTNAPASTQAFINTLIGGTSVFASFAGGALETAANVGIMAYSLSAAGISIGAVAAVVGEVLLVLAALGVAAYVVYEAWNSNFAGIRDMTMEAWPAIKATIVEVATTIRDTVVSAVSEIQAWWSEIAPSVERAVANIMVAIAWFEPVWSAWWGGIRGVVHGAWVAITGVIEGAWKIISGIFNVFIHLLAGDWSALWDDIKRIWEGWWTLFSSLFSGVVETIYSMWKSYFSAGTGLIAQVWTAMWDNARATWDSWSGAFSTAFSSSWERVKAIFSFFTNALTGNWSGALESLATIIGVKKEVIVMKIADLIGGIRDKFDALIAGAKAWGANLIDMFVDGIRSRLAAVGEAVMSVASKVSGVLGFHSPTDEGPAKDSDKWAPNFVNMFAEGIVNARPALQAALNGMAMDMQVGVSGAGLAMGGAGYGGRTVNVYVTYNGTGGRNEADDLATKVRRQVAMVT